MLYVDISNPSLPSPVIDDIVFFSLRYLMPRKKNLSLSLEFTDDFPEEVDGYHLFVYKNEHEIEIRSDLDKEDLITAIFHEMVHVKQFERRELKSVRGGHIWKNQFFPFCTPYLDRPWETEAYMLQEEMISVFEKLYT